MSETETTTDLVKSLLDSVPSKHIEEVAMAMRLAATGASDAMIAGALGITKRELGELQDKNPAILRAIHLARTATFVEVSNNLLRLAKTSSNVEAIKLAMGLMGDEYKPQSQAATVNVQANTFNVALPSTKEALAYLESDPSIIEAEIEGVS